MSGFFAMRHGRTLANEHHLRCGGDHDIPLTDAGREAIQSMRQQIDTLQPRPRLIVTSDLIRTRETAAIIKPWLSVRIITVPGLNERRLGRWNGQSQAVTHAQLSAGETPPGGEPAETFRVRVLTAFTDEVAPFIASTPIIVTSAGVVRVLTETYGDRALPRINNGEIRWLSVPA